MEQTVSSHNRSINVKNSKEESFVGGIKLNRWINKPDSFIETKDTITICAGEKTDFFCDPGSDFTIHSAPLYSLAADDEFTFICRISPEFRNTYDAGALMLYVTDLHWVKFAFEKTDLGTTSVVAVVTDGVSDDSNGEVITEDFLYLKLARKDGVISLCYSLNKTDWRMVRLFRFKISSQQEFYVGIEAQSPLGEGCRVKFSDIYYSPEPPKDLRKGI